MMPRPPDFEQRLAKWEDLRAAGMMPRLGLSPIWQTPDRANDPPPARVATGTRPPLHETAEQGWQDEGGQNGN